MQKHVAAFSDQIQEAIRIAKGSDLRSSETEIKNVLICGIGGSGIGGKIVSNFFVGSCKVPISTCNEYELPGYVNENTLCIMSSYSGNTEEVQAMLGQAIDAGAEIACISSGGKLAEIATKRNFNLIKIPGGNPPRSCLGYSLIQQVQYLVHYKLVDGAILAQLEESVAYLDDHEKETIKTAEDLAERLVGKLPIIYSSGAYASIAARFCQQLNENSKMLCWHNKVPELNHNEIVGWTKRNDLLAPIFIKDETDYYRTQTRIAFTEKVVEQYTDTVLEIAVRGRNQIEKALYLIHLTDWISVKIAEQEGVDPIQIEVIDALKRELSALQ